MPGSKGSNARSSRRMRDTGPLQEDTAQELHGMQQKLEQLKIRSEKDGNQPRNRRIPMASESPYFEEIRKVYRIYNDVDKEYVEEEGHYCDFCQEDIACDPEHLESKFPNPAEAAILSCGHVYHFKCFQMTIGDEQSPDPPCILCISSRF